MRRAFIRPVSKLSTPTAWGPETRRNDLDMPGRKMSFLSDLHTGTHAGERYDAVDMFCVPGENLVSWEATKRPELHILIRTAFPSTCLSCTYYWVRYSHGWTSTTVTSSVQKHDPQRRHGLQVSQFRRFPHVLERFACIWGYRNPVKLEQP